MEIIADSEILAKRVSDEKWGAAIHEAGHAAIINRFGGIARAWIYPTHTTDPKTEKLWVGRCQFIAMPGQVDFSNMPKKYHPKKTPANSLRLIGIAGSAAELVEQGLKEGIDWSDLYWYVSDSFWMDYHYSMSESDKRLIGDVSDEVRLNKDLAHVLRLLKWEWNKVLSHANQMLYSSDEEATGEPI